ncbi:MAG: hypothetical protein HRU26_17175, partial [Psychroserpens sp.]|nr:hypothetical protein [Psychroserpens sp.]
MFRQLSLSLLICMCFGLSGYGQDSFCDQLKSLSDLVSSEHYQPKVLDDSLSSGVFDIFISRLDSEKRLFIKSDIEQFEKDRFGIDNYIKDGKCEFIQDYISTLNSRIDNAVTMISSLEDETLNYSGKDTIYFKPDRKVKFVDDVVVLKDFWNKRIRYNILFELIEKDSGLTSLKTKFKDLEQEVKSKVIQQEICKLNELQNRHGSLKAFVEDAFLNAYLAYHDPNSIYFNNSEKTTYVNSLSNDQLSFGIITSKNDNGNIIIADITSGSPAFLDGNFEANDVIKSLES